MVRVVFDIHAHIYKLVYSIVKRKVRVRAKGQAVDGLSDSSLCKS